MHPLLYVLAFFASGILAEERLGASSNTILLFLSLSLALILFLYIRKTRFSAVVASVPFFFLGMLVILPHINPEIGQGHILSYAQSHALTQDLGMDGWLDIEGVVYGRAEKSGERTRFLIEVEKVYGHDSSDEVNGRLLTIVPQAPSDMGKGDRIRFLCRPRGINDFGNPGEYGYKKRLSMEAVFVSCFVKDKRFFARTGAGKRGLIEGLRENTGALIDSSGAGNKDALKALIIGDAGGIDKTTKEPFRLTGTAHILSISGLHVGLVAWVSLALMLFLLKRSTWLMLSFDIKKLSLAASILPVIIYGLMAGLEAPALRSVLMAAAFVFTVLLGRGRAGLNAGALAALIILVFSPQALWDISLQLTFAAVFSIIYLSPYIKGVFERKKTGDENVGKLKAVMGRVREKALAGFIITLCAAIGTYPLTAYYFHKLAVTGLAANLVAVPLTGIIVSLLFVGSMLARIWGGLAVVAVNIAGMFFHAMLSSVRFFSALPSSSIIVSMPSWPEILVFYSLVAVIPHAGRVKRLRFASAGCALVLLLLWSYPHIERRISKELKATFISIGEGDSALIELPGGKTMLIDGGGFFSSDFDTGERIVAPFLLSKKIKTIDYMVLSHPQRDHMAGLKYIARNFNVKEFWWSGRGVMPNELKELLERLALSGAVIKTLDSSSPALAISGVRIEALGPGPDAALDVNNSSLVLRLSYGKTSFLFTGDIGKDGEDALLEKDIRATVLKSPHHGSRTSSGMEFLKKAGSEAVVISAGRDNPSGHPHPEILERYRAMGIKVFRTDIDGAVIVSTDGSELKASGYLTGRGL
ncbi:MAG: DNA internalization-related competence protein ComEC/Rec2 [Deltaproteobacteria bacterium]|nr:DNA internalization-related competence protein ComEC/Rec2 [Deltaproteobacteria bacterium]